MKNQRTAFTLPVFGGQESVSFDPSFASKLNVTYESIAGAGLLLQSCHAAFLKELSSLSPEAHEKVQICAQDFEEETSVVNPPLEKYLHNPVLSGTTLVLRQSLQYLHVLNGSFGELKPRRQTNLAPYPCVLGCSSGMLCAAVAASATSVLSFINHAVEAYRLSFWVGLRVHLYCLDLDPLFLYDDRPWTIVLLNTSEDAVKEYIRTFNKDSQLLQLTAYISQSSFTISGHPNDLRMFKETLPDSTTVSDAAINALYHTPHLVKAVDQVLSDISVRTIHFPSFDDLVFPLRSCSTGDLIDSSSSGGSLVKLIVEMTLTEPVRWDRVVEKTSVSIPELADVRVLNMGLRPSLSKVLEKSFSRSLPRTSVEIVPGCDLDSLAGCREPIAVVGMAVRLPKARNMDELWDLLDGQINTAEDIPFDRFDVMDYRRGEMPGRELNVSKANFLDDAAEFDNKFFNISPREATSMDPQQRILLHVAHEALEQAGYVPNATPSFSTDTFGCYIGAATSDYRQNLRDEIDVYYSTGTLSSFLNGRLSYHLGLSGPSMVVDTACSSSLVAIHQAVRALTNRDCNAALAGGVNIISSPDMFMGLDRAHFLSPSGQCRPFDASADGYSRAEGCCIFVLKRLKDALQDNDRIHGTIRGIEVNQSGKSQSITRPHGPTQERLFKKLLASSTVRPVDISYVEAHGTGTRIGDATEMQSIRAVLANADRPSHALLHIGSIKANTGHLEAASGAASLAKVLMMMRKHSIPAQISLECLNKGIAPLGNDSCRVNTERVSWPISQGMARVALINNFGASGSNAAALIEEHRPLVVHQPHHSVTSFVFGISAKDGDAIERTRASLIKWLDAHPDVSLANLSYTLTARRISYVHRLAVAATTIPQLISELTRASPSRVQDNCPTLVFVFSGQGGHYMGMGCALYRSSPVFRNHINECNTILITAGFKGVLSLISQESGATQEDLESTEAYQAAFFSLQYGLAKVWMSWGVHPTALVAHSLGEYAALVIAGSLSLRDALIMVATRARLMFQNCCLGSTGMLAVSLGVAELQPMLDSSDRWSNLIVSCDNSPNNCVVSGPSTDLLSFKARFEADTSRRAHRLDVPFAFHSPAMAPIFNDLREISKKVTLQTPSIPIASAFFGRVIKPGDRAFQQLEYFPRHCIDPVHFADAVKAYMSYPTFAGGTTAWLEIGPRPSLLPMLKSFPQLSGSIFLPSLRNRENCWTTLSKTLAALYLFHAVKWRAVFAQIGPVSVIDLPSYPFSTKTFWIPYKEPAYTLRKPKLEYSLLRSWVRYPDVAGRSNAIFESSILDFKAFLDGHRVGGVPLCPASVYIELAAAGSTHTLEHLSQYPPGSTLYLSSITFHRPLAVVVVDETEPSRLRLTIDPVHRNFSIASFATCEDEIQHATGNCRHLQVQEVQRAFQAISPMICSRVQDILSAPSDSYSSRTVYEVIFPRVVEYSKAFQTVRQLSLSADSMEAAATMCISPGFRSGSFVAHPLFIDTLIHVPGFVANLHGGQTHAYICSKISSVTLVPSLIHEQATYLVFAVAVRDGEDMLCTSYAIKEGNHSTMVARAEGIRFKRVLLSSLASKLTDNASVRVRDTVASAGSRLSTPEPYNTPSLGLTSPPSTPSSSPSGSSTYSPTLTTPIRQLVADVLKINMHSIHEDDELGALGLDSLSSIEIASVFRKHFHSDLPSSFLCPKRTIGDLEAVVAVNDCISNGPMSPQSILESSGSKEATMGNRLTLIQESHSSKAPLVLIHDGSGFVTSYSRLTDLQRPVYGVHNSSLTSATGWSSISQMAESYAALVKEQGYRCVILGGWSFGGIVAFEVARILQGWGVRVMGALLIDSPDPYDHVPLVPALLKDVVSNSHHIPHKLRDLCQQQFSASSKLLDQYDPMHSVSGGPMPQVVLLQSTEGYRSPSGVEVPAWLTSRHNGNSLTSGWEILTGAPIKIFNIPGNHFQAFDPPMIPEVSERVAEACDYLEQQ